MNKADFRTEAIKIIESFWRIRAGSAIYRQFTRTNDIANLPLTYPNVPQLGTVMGLLPSETVQQAQDRLKSYLDDRLAQDIFFSIIALFEARLVWVLAAHLKPTDGTLGGLRTRIEATISVPPNLSSDFEEILKRRNCMVHNGSLADAKYLSAAAAIASRASPYVTAVVISSSVKPNADYLTYMADVLIRYSDVL